MCFIQIYSGGSHGDNNWDAHGDLELNHNKHARNTDKPIAGLLKDLKRRGLLDETIVVWGGEFGRQPTAEYASGGRDHNSNGFTMWMAGGGIKGGVSVGQTDELGSAAVERPLALRTFTLQFCNKWGWIRTISLISIQAWMKSWLVLRALNPFTRLSLKHRRPL